MTKVECPGPGFKGLKWKWIQDHAKEQQEREKERISTQQVHLPGATQPHCQQQQPAPNCSGEPPKPAHTFEQHASAARQSDDGWGLLQQVSANVPQSQTSVKIEPANGAGPSPRASLTGDVLNTYSGERVQLKLEQASGAEPLAASISHAVPSGGLDASSVPYSQSTAPATGAAGASVGPPTAASAAAAASAGISLTGSGVSPTPTMPATGLLRRKSTDVLVSVPAASGTLSPVAVTSPSAVLPGTADASQGTTATNAQVVAQAAAAAAAPSCILTPPSAPAPATTHSAAPQPLITATAAQPSGPAPSSVQPANLGAARVRLPPARGPSMNVAAVTAKGGDDFESMFTPLLSMPSVKSETPRAGIASRSGSLLPGPQASLPNAAGGAAPAAVASVSYEAGGPSQGLERKGPPKKASRMPDGRSSAGQPSTATAAAELPDGDHGPSGRSRTPVAQVSPAAAAATGAAKEASVSGATTCTIAPGKSQPQSQVAPQPHSQSQSAQHQQSQPLPTQQQQQRASGAKHAKDGARMREGGEGAAAAVTATGGEVAAPSAGAGGVSSAAASRGGTGGDRVGAPASAGSTPAPAPAHSGGEAGERKRPRSEGSKPKGTSLTGDPLVDSGWPYGETLADRIKRAKRATTSSSDQEGPHSHGGSAERLTSHAAANAGHAVVEDGYCNAAGAGGPSSGARGADEPPPRPAVSAEAQSRGAEAAAPGNIPARGVHMTASGAAAASGAGGANAKQQQQQQQRQQPPAQGRGKPYGRSEEPSMVPPALFPRSSVQAADRSLEQPAQNPANNLRVSGGGAVTDSSGGGGGPSGPQRASGPQAAGRTAGGGQGASGAAAGAGTKRSGAEVPRRHNAPPAKLPRSDPHLPRPHQPHGQDRREAAAGATAAGSGRGGSSLPPPPASKPAHRASSGPPAGRADGGPGPRDAQGQPTSGIAPGQAPAPAGPPAPPPGRPGRLGESDTPAAGSCKGPVVAGSRGSKDGAGDKGACGPRHAGGALDAACGGGGAGEGGAGAAATTTTEPKTDSDTRTSRVVECFFEFDLPCRTAGGSASISGLGSSGSLQAGHGLATRLGDSRFFGGAPATAAPIPRGGAGGGGGATAAAQLLDLGKIRSFKELWTQLAALYDGILPDEMDSKLIYLDEEGDWIMVTPDEPWSSVAAAATKVLVTNRT